MSAQTKERQSKSDASRGTARWILSVTKNKAGIVGLTAAEGVLGISSVLFALLLRQLINAASAQDRRGVFLYAVCMGGLILAQILLRALRRHLLEYTRSTFENRLKRRLFSTLLHKDFASVSTVHSGEWMNRLTSDTVVVADGLTEIIPGVVGMAVRLIGAVIAILCLEPLFAALVIPGGILLILLSYAFRRVLKKLHRDIRSADGVLRVFMQERLENLLLLRAYGQNAEVLSEADRRMGEHRAARMKRNRFSNFCNAGFGLISNGIYLFAAVYCAYGILSGTVSYGTFVALLQLVSQVQSPVANITGYLPQYYAMIASAQRLQEAEDFADDDAKSGEEERESAPAEEDESAAFYSNDFVSLSLRQISFSYPPTDQKSMPPVLSDFSLCLKKGDYLALTGASGCGKSTILKLLLCLYRPNGGSILIQTKDSILPLSPKYRRLFAYVPQKNALMSGTIRSSIAFSDEQRMQDEEGLYRALTIACAKDFVCSLKCGLDTRLGEAGLGLSEGQLQRLSIARAVFSDRPILLLDEATSALDEATEEQVLRNLRSMTDKTVIIVTHRPAAQSVCNRIISHTSYGWEEKKRS